MPYVITEPCINCKDAACTSVCPVDAIHPKKDDLNFQRTTQLFIDPDTCICCSHCVDECPVNAIYADDELPKQWTHYIQLNANHFQTPAK